MVPTLNCVVYGPIVIGYIRNSLLTPAPAVSRPPPASSVVPGTPSTNGCCAINPANRLLWWNAVAAPNVRRTRSPRVWKVRSSNAATKPASGSNVSSRNFTCPAAPTPPLLLVHPPHRDREVLSLFLFPRRSTNRDAFTSRISPSARHNKLCCICNKVLRDGCYPASS